MKTQILEMMNYDKEDGGTIVRQVHSRIGGDTQSEETNEIGEQNEHSRQLRKMEMPREKNKEGKDETRKHEGQSSR